jgi:hypothetical protein
MNPIAAVFGAAALLGGYAVASGLAARRARRPIEPATTDDALVQLATAAPNAPLVLQHGPDETLVLAETNQALGGWRPVGTGRVSGRRRERHLPLDTTLTPTVVTIGRLGDDDVLVNLEAIGALSVIGEPAHVARQLRDIRDELRWPAQARAIELVNVGDAREAGPDAPPSWDAALARIDERIAHAEMMRSRRNAASAVSARARGTGLPPLVVVAADLPDDTARRHTLAHVAATRPGGVALVVVGNLPGAWTLTCDATGGDLEPLGLHVEACNTPEPDVAPASLAARPSAATTVESHGGVRVSVLGCVEVRGATLTPKCAELVAYLATHPDGANELTLRTALWPDRDAPRGTFNNVVSAARKHLGPTADGTSRLIRHTNGRYRLAPDVTCDLVDLERLTRGVRHEPSDENRRRLAAALYNVRGEPFHGWTGGDWPFDENISAHAQVLIDEARELLSAPAASRLRLIDEAQSA